MLSEPRSHPEVRLVSLSSPLPLHTLQFLESAKTHHVRLATEQGYSCVVVSKIFLGNTQSNAASS